MHYPDSDVYPVKRSRYNRNRIIIYYLFVLFSLITVLLLCYHILDNITILMYAPENWKISENIFEIQYYNSIQDKIKIYSNFILYLIIQIIIATFVFIISKKRNNVQHPF